MTSDENLSEKRSIDQLYFRRLMSDDNQLQQESIKPMSKPQQ